MLDDWKQTVVNSEATIAEAVESLNISKKQIVLVVDTNSALVGTITDGDIRRGMLAGIDLSDNVDTIINKDPFVVSSGIDSETALQLMKINRIRQLPVVDDSRCIVDLHHWDSLLAPNLRDNMMVIMAGGKGMRLRPDTANCPKPLLKISGKPMLEHIINRAIRDGFRHFVLAVHYLGHMIEDYFGDGSLWGVKIEYIREKTPLGTAGALSLLHVTNDLPIVISNGDVLSDIQYGDIVDFHSQYGAQATMAVRQDQIEYPFGVVDVEGVDIVGFEEKPRIIKQINAGIYVLNSNALDLLNKNEYCDMPTLFSHLKDRGQRTVAYPMYEPWIDVGRTGDLAIARDNNQ